jgi:predicted MFS family arabinose efflux permease
MFPAKTPTESSGFHALLKNRRFLMLWSGQIFSQVGDKVFFTFLVAILETYHSPIFQNSMYSILMLAFTLPAIFFGSAAGIFVDRFSKKQILVVSNIIRALLILAIPLLPKEFLILLVITFIISTITQFFAPAEQVAIPILVLPQNLMTANALFTTTMMGALIVGFAIGEPLLSLSRDWGGKYGQEILLASLYFLASAVIQWIPFKESPVSLEEIAVHPWQDLKEGLHYLWKNRLVQNAMIQLMTLYGVFAALTVLAIPLAEDVGLKRTQFGFLLAAAGIGMVAGAGVLGHWGDRFHHKPLPLLGFLSMAFVLAVFTFTQELWLSLGLSMLLGVGAALIGVPMQTLIQQQTPEKMRGKVFGFQNNAVNIAVSAPLAITSLLKDQFGLRAVLLCISLLVCGVGVWAWRNTRSVLQDVL